MNEKVVTVRYLNVKNNFCYLSPSTTKDLGLNTTVRISYGDKEEAYFSVDVSVPNITDDTIGLNSLYAKLLGIAEGEPVGLSSLHNPNKVQSFTIHPIRSDDFHVLDLLKTEVENCILRQTQVVNDNQEMLIWIGNNLNVPVRVVSVQPSSPGLLTYLTELVILPIIKSKNNNSAELENCKGINEENNFDFSSIFSLPPRLTEVYKKIANKHHFYLNRKNFFKGRLVPFECLKSTEVSKYFYDFTVFILEKVAPPSWKKLSSFENPLFCSLQTINSQDTKTISVRVFLISDHILNNNMCLDKNIFVDDRLFEILKCNIGIGVILKVLERRSNTEEIVVHTKGERISIKHMLKEYLANICKYQEFVLNADVPIILNSDKICSLKFIPVSEYCCINEELLRNCKYSFVDHSSITRSVSSETKSKKFEFVNVKIQESICDDIMRIIRINLNDMDEFGSSLIIGNFGSGKSTILNKMQSCLTQAPLFIYSEVVKCKTLKGKTLDSLHKYFVTVLENLVMHQPSLLLVDDLHVLCANVSQTDGQAQNAVHYDGISEMLYSLFKSVTEHYSIGIVGTTLSTDKLNKNIYCSRQCYLFENSYKIEDLSLADRSHILEHYLKNRGGDLDFEDIAQKTEGYVFQDLFDFTQKVIFQSIKDDPESDHSIVTKEHCAKVLSEMTILSLSDVKLHSPGDRDFSTVGGMDTVKLLMTEKLYWPIKYPNIFNNAPLRLQTGMLLYGSPGTGKTLLAAAAAKQFGIRLISVKGPELLSKYIGASEQAVRNVFVQAQSAKPCMIFFDEFDSLAPRRGHDSTGVTDRVVNQLLTQMDGVESLSGVCVVAATSRPDLIDPALLRPGRLDKKIFCPLPDVSARLDILQVLSKSLNFSEDVDLREIAESSSGFTGADLQYLLHNAQLSTVEHVLLSGDKVEEVQPINQEILRKALSKTKPSLSEKEKNKYNLIYTKFQGKTDTTYLRPGSKASLA